MRFAIFLVLCFCWTVAFGSSHDHDHEDHAHGGGQPRGKADRGKSGDSAGIVRKIKVKGNDEFRMAMIMTKDGGRMKVTQLSMKTNPVPGVGVRVFGKAQKETTEDFDAQAENPTGTITDQSEADKKKAKVRARMGFFSVMEVKDIGLENIDVEDNIVQQVFLASRQTETTFTPIVATEGTGEEGHAIHTWTTELKPVADDKPSLFGLETIVSAEFFKKGGEERSPNAAKVTPWFNPAGFNNTVGADNKICVVARFFYRAHGEDAEVNAEDTNQDDIANLNEEGDGATFLNWDRTATVTTNGVTSEVDVVAAGFTTEETLITVPEDAPEEFQAAMADRENLTGEASRKLCWCYNTTAGTLADVTLIEHDPSIEGELQEAEGSSSAQASLASLVLVVTMLLY